MLVSPSVYIVVYVPVEDSATTAAPASSDGTPGLVYGFGSILD